MKAGSLIVLGVVFLGAFVGRAGVLASSLAEGEGAGAATAGGPVCINGALAESLKQELASLEERKVALVEEEQTTRILGAQVERRIADLEALNQSLTTALDQRVAARNEDVRRVAVIYEQMKPELAGAVIGGMDPEFAAGLLLAMSGESASAIMATLAADRAYAITVLMADAAVKQRGAG